MNWILYLLLIFVVFLLVIVFFLPLKCELSISLENNSGYLLCEFLLMGLRVYVLEKEFKLFQLQSEGMDMFQLDKIKQMITINKKLKSKKKARKRQSRLKVNNMEWQTEVGTVDAASTAFIKGLVWSLKGIIHAYLDQVIYLADDPTYTVDALYNQAYFHSEVRGIFSLRIGQAIYTKIQYTKTKKKLEETQEANK